MNDTASFPQRALLLGVMWFPATFMALWVCSALGWWSARHIEPALAFVFTAVFLAAFLLQVRAVFRALAVLRARPETRQPLHWLLLAVGILTAVLAAGFAAVFGFLAFG